MDTISKMPANKYTSPSNSSSSTLEMRRGHRRVYFVCRSIHITCHRILSLEWWIFSVCVLISACPMYVSICAGIPMRRWHLRSAADWHSFLNVSGLSLYTSWLNEERTSLGNERMMGCKPKKCAENCFDVDVIYYLTSERHADSYDREKNNNIFKRNISLWQHSASQFNWCE